MQLTPARIAVGAATLVVTFLGAVSQAAPPFFGIFLIVGSVIAVGLSIPLGVLGAVFDRRYDPDRTLRRLVAAVGVAGVLTAVPFALFVDPGAAPLVGVVVLVLGAFWYVLPLAVGVWLARRRRTRIRYVVAAWPVSLVASSAAFFAPSLVGRTNLTFLDGPLAAASLVGLAVLVIAGPGIVGSELDRRRSVR